MIRPFDEGELQLAAKQRPRLVRYCHAIALQPFQCPLKIVDAETQMIDGVAPARFQTCAIFPGIRESGLRIAYGINDDTHIVHDQSHRRSSLAAAAERSEEHTSELQSHLNLVCRLLLEKKKKQQQIQESRC